MHNMHAGLSQVLAAQLMAERREPAAHGPVVRSLRPLVADDASGYHVSGGGWFGTH